METSNTKFLIIFLFLAITLTGCSELLSTESEELEKQFLQIVRVSDMNNNLEVLLDDERTSFESGEEIFLTLHNKSPNSLYFDTSSLVILLASQDSHKWIDVKNAYTYSCDLELSPNGTILLDTQSVTVEPILDRSSFNSKKDITIRIVVIGEIMDGKNRTGEKVGTYVDVVLKP